MAKSRDQLIDEAIARDEIRDLAILYCEGAWNDDADLTSQLFTEDCVFEISSANPPVRVNGREALRKYLGETRPSGMPRPLVHDHAIEFRPDGTATGWSVIEARSPRQGMKSIGIGQYVDEYAKVDGRWRIRSRRINIVPLLKPEDRAPVTDAPAPAKPGDFSGYFTRVLSKEQKTRDQLLDDLLDREGIRQLPIRFAMGAWTTNGSLEADQFAEQGSFGVEGRPGYCKGRENLRKALHAHILDVTPRPIIHDHIIELEGESRARGRCYNEVRTFQYGMRLMGVGWYDEEYVKEKGEWKYSSRTVKWLYRNEKPAESL